MCKAFDISFNRASSGGDNYKRTPPRDEAGQPVFVFPLLSADRRSPRILLALRTARSMSISRLTIIPFFPLSTTCRREGIKLIVKRRTKFPVNGNITWKSYSRLVDDTGRTTRERRNRAEIKRGESPRLRGNATEIFFLLPGSIDRSHYPRPSTFSCPSTSLSFSISISICLSPLYLLLGATRERVCARRRRVRVCEST